MNIIYYLAAIGYPDMNIKLDILIKNLNYLHNQINRNFSIIINCYGHQDEVMNCINQLSFLDNIYLHYVEKAILTELWLTNPYNDLVKDYDYLLFIYDDVEIENMNINDMINIKNKFNIELLSPRIEQSTHSFMNTHQDNSLSFMNALEIYCLLLTYDDFKRYLSIQTLENKWTWGTDILFGYFKINAAIYYKYSANHKLPSKSNQSIASKQMVKYLRKLDLNVRNIEKLYLPVIKTILI